MHKNRQILTLKQSKLAGFPTLATRYITYQTYAYPKSPYLAGKATKLAALITWWSHKLASNGFSIFHALCIRRLPSFRN